MEKARGGREEKQRGDRKERKKKGKEGGKERKSYLAVSLISVWTTFTCKDT